MKIALIAMSGVRACDEELLRLGLILPGFVERSKVIASLPLLKVSYSGVAFWHWAFGGIPGMWKPWAVIDLAFLVLFIAAYRALPAPAAKATADAAR